MNKEQQPDPFDRLIECLKQDGLSDAAARLDLLLHHTAWTTGSELIGELRLEMKKIRGNVRSRARGETKEAYRSAARVIWKWVPFFWP